MKKFNSSLELSNAILDTLKKLEDVHGVARFDVSKDYGKLAAVLMCLTLIKGNSKLVNNEFEGLRKEALPLIKKYAK